MTALACLHCGELERVEIFDVWTSGEFMLDTCCEGMRDAANEFLAEDPKAAAKWLSTLEHEGDPEAPPLPILPALFPGGLRRVISDGGIDDVGGQLLLDWNLRVVPIRLQDAKAFIRKHHRHNAPPVSWRFGAGVRNGSHLIGVVMVGRPVARALDHKRIVEVNRLCVRADVPRGFVWNACSLLYGWAAREAKRRGFARVITYTLESELGTTLRAAGWKVDGLTKGGSWNRASRARTDKAPTIRKTRWARELS